MLRLVQKHIEQTFPFLENKNLLVAISGGIDSVVLVHLLQQLNYKITLAHCNFGLRGKESDTDEQFVIDFAQKLHCKIHTRFFNTKDFCSQHKMSTQLAARELRYQWFDELCQVHSLDYILTAHHANDVLETFFINLSRGTGLDGLTGIPPVNGKVIRPLLPYTREQIVNYAATHQLEWREDQSNAETKYIRNKIRHLIVPELQELHPAFETNFIKTLNYLQQSKSFIQNQIQSIKKRVFVTQDSGFIISIKELKSLDSFVLFELFKPYGFLSISEIKKLLTTQGGKEINSETHRLVTYRDALLLHPIATQNKDHYCIHNASDIFTLPIKLEFSTNPKELSANTIAIDLSKISFPLTLRKRKDGDVFYPTGMVGKKKVSKYFKDLRLSKIQKEAVWLLCTKDNQVLWIVGYRADRKLCETSIKEKLLYISKL